MPAVLSLPQRPDGRGPDVAVLDGGEARNVIGPERGETSLGEIRPAEVRGEHAGSHVTSAVQEAHHAGSEFPLVKRVRDKIPVTLASLAAALAAMAATASGSTS